MEDSRLKGFRGRVTHPVLPLERTYCASCGRVKGWVSSESMEFIRASSVIVLCDDCAARLGAPPGHREIGISEIDIAESEPRP